MIVNSRQREHLRIDLCSKVAVVLSEIAARPCQLNTPTIAHKRSQLVLDGLLSVVDCTTERSEITDLDARSGPRPTNTRCE